MELRHVRYFLLVAEEANFTRAAERAGIGQPPLSQQIRALEREIGTPLFRRTPRGAELTEAGLAFLPEARALARQAEAAVEAARRGGQGLRGTLRVGFTASAAFVGAVPEAIRQFVAASPEVAVSLVEAETRALLERLSAGELDVALTRLGRIEPPGVAVTHLLDEPMAVAVSHAHPLARRKTVPLAALAEEPLVMFPREAGASLYDEIIATCWKAGLEPRIGQQAPQFSSALNLVAAGLGMTLVPASMAQVQSMGVRYLAIRGESPRVRLSLCVRPREGSLIVARFARMVRERCRPPR
ncbi:LysR family transcriptional regulator [[Pseudomonas] boreopolis]|uniref:LysR family transcriptional regulator n=1 Tax=Xanthomonas boreopolis TaxID=86183 RepID=UPI003D9ADE6A